MNTESQGGCFAMQQFFVLFCFKLLVNDFVSKHVFLGNPPLYYYYIL